MDRPGHDTVNFFVGTEVEHTPAFGMLTLFVVGSHDSSRVLDIVKESRSFTDPSRHINHIYFGANQSFPKLDINDGDGWQPWERMIQDCLEFDCWCTLDLDVSCAEGLLESALVEYDRFIPMISVKLPYIRQLGYNATLKLDDRDFQATNPGVWCHSIHALQNRSVFTDWSKYTQDKIVG